MKWAMIGRSPGNGHPYSWSAICNGYNPVEMRKIEFQGIPRYLDAAPREQFGVGDVKVTHIWMPDREEAELCARCSLISNVVDSPEDAIGKVDAAVLAVDTGETHLAMAKPFLEAGLPVFLDKPLCLTLDDLAAFQEDRKRGYRFLSCSSARFCVEFLQARDSGDYGEIRSLHMTVPHKWETYGIHGVEGLSVFLGARALKVATIGSRDCSVTSLEYPDGKVATVTCTERGFPGLWLDINSSKKSCQIVWKEYFISFRDTLRAFYQYLVTGKDPFPFGDTVELTKIIALGLTSREEGGKCLSLTSFP